MLELPHRFTFQNRIVRWGRIGTGPALVAIHGTPFSAQVWRRIAPVLAGKRTVYYFDLLGYGQSDMQAGQDVSLGIQNRVLAALLQEWGLCKPEILAHDFGAATALRAHFLDGIGFGALTIFDAVAMAPWGSPLVQHVRNHERAFAGMPGYMHDAVLRAYLQTAAYNPLPEEAMEIYLAPWRGKTGQSGFYHQIAQMDQKHTDEFESRYRQPGFPVKVLWGERDAWVPMGKGEELATRLAAPLRCIPNSGHLMQEDAPEAIVAGVFE